MLKLKDVKNGSGPKNEPVTAPGGDESAAVQIHRSGLVGSRKCRDDNTYTPRTVHQMGRSTPNVTVTQRALRFTPGCSIEQWNIVPKLSNGKERET